jgi:hypothetical protein
LLDKEAQMIVLCYPKDQLKTFFATLPQIISIIKTLTGQLFIPTVVQSSPIFPSHDCLVIMRNIERLGKLKLDTDSILDEKKLSKQFVVRNFKFLKKDSPEEMKKYLQAELE